MSEQTGKPANSLINESSPYLLQHAYNPVDWVPFSPKAFETARREDKLVLVSVGYSACHWCHVMEKECFEDKEVAELMNAGFVSIKVDREERSDVDMLYMQAVQLMSGQGGWPLNCFVLPDGRPFYGGTYFNKTQWLHVLRTLNDLHRNDPGKIREFAGQLTEGIQKAELIGTTGKEPTPVNKALLQTAVAKWKTLMDLENGGPNRAPKFPLPSNYQFLLRYAILENDHELLKHVQLTLEKMASGGIYDQLHGGFARYSTDLFWKVPHFEKMLYDNAQLASLYAEAYTLTKNSLFKETALGVLDFVEREWLQPEGCFFSAYDADSEGEEGKYYVWTREELAALLGDEFQLFADYYQVNDTGYWEQGNYILMRTGNAAAIAANHGLSLAALNERIAACREVLRREATGRVKPGLDDKSITSWNALMCSAYAVAYLAFGDTRYRDIALRSMAFMTERLMQPDGRLFRTYKNGQAKIDAFLEDYAFVIEAQLNCYLITQNEQFLEAAGRLCEKTLELFRHPDSDFLYYTAGHDLVARTTETSDNVIPASNSRMALNLFYLGTLLDRSEWRERALRLTGLIAMDLKEYASGYSNWGCLALHACYPFHELAIVGNNVDEKLKELYQQGLTNAILAVHAGASGLPLLRDRHKQGQTLIYVCRNNTCQLPVGTVEEAMLQLA